MDVNKLKRRAPKSSLIACRIDVNLKEQVDAYCIAHKISVSALLGELIAKFIESLNDTKV